MKMYEISKLLLNFFEAAACIFAFAYWGKLRLTIWKWFPFYLLFIVLLGLAGRYLASEPALAEYNPMLYNYLGFPVQFLFLYSIFLQHKYFSHRKTVVVVAAIVYLASMLINWLFIDKSNLYFTSFAYTMGCMLLLILCINYFFSLTKSAELLYFSRDTMFWFCSGLLIHYIGTLPYFSLHNALAMNYKNILETYLAIWPFLGCTMYIFFIIGIRWGKVK